MYRCWCRLPSPPRIQQLISARLNATLLNHALSYSHIASTMSEYGSDEDEDLRRAIALSLGEPDPAAQNPIDLTGIDEETQLEKEDKSMELEEAKSTSIRPLKPPQLTILGLARRKMEEERLARDRKRKASKSPPPSTARHFHISKAARTYSDPVVSLSDPPTSHTGASPMQKSSQMKPYVQERTALRASEIQYPSGVVKRTWASGYPREGDDIKIEVCELFVGFRKTPLKNHNDFHGENMVRRPSRQFISIANATRGILRRIY